MHTSQLIIATDIARPIAKRLYHHWRARWQTEESEGKITFIFNQEDQAQLHYNDQQLQTILSTQTADAHAQWQNVLKNHINRMAKQEFDATWQAL